MRKFLHISIFSSLFAFFLPLTLQAQTPGTKVTGSDYLYHGTLSNRNVGGVPTWDYFGAPAGSGTNFDSSPYVDFHYNDAPRSRRINYRMLFPSDYNSGTTEKYPAIIMLHGLGEGGGRGTLNGGYSDYPTTSTQYLNNDHQLYHGGEVHMKVVQGTDTKGANGQSREFPGVVIFPQTNSATPQIGWTQGELDKVVFLVEDLLKTYPIDPNKIYIHGLSNGGNGVWKILEKRPDLFAAMLPMSAVPTIGNDSEGNPWYDLSKVKEIPTWLFQGALDKAPKANVARISIDELEAIGATPRYTEYPDVAHPTWNPAYNEIDFFSWMLGKSKLSIHASYGDTLFCEGEEVNVKLSISPGFAAYEWRKVNTTDILSTSHFLDVTELGSYEVRFKRETVWSPGWTAWSTPKVIGIKPPTPPALITASGSTTLPSLDGANSVTLSVPDVYESYVWQNSSSTTNSITVSSGGTYKLSVTEPDGCPSNFSAVVVTVNGPTNIIATPDNFSAEPVSSTRINLFWNDKSENETGFEIYRATSPGGSYTFVTKTKSNTTFYADKGLSPNTTYYYRMRAVNNLGSSPYTGEINSETGSDTENPSAPQNLTATTNLDLESITLNWDPATDNDEVKEYIVFLVNADNSVEQQIITTNTTFTDTDLTEGNNYTYYVIAKDNSNNNSIKSNQVTEMVAFCGLQYTLYTGVTYNSVNDFEPDQIKDDGKIGNFFRTPAVDYFNSIDQPEVYYGLTYEGYIFIETAGIYKFWTTSDDGSRLFIDNTEVVVNDQRQGSTTKGGQLDLTAGRHRIAVKYFQATGGQNLQVEYQGPDGSGIERKIIPSSILCSSGGGNLPTVPEVPSNLTATAISEKQINLSWSHISSNESGFEIYRSKTNQDSYELVDFIPTGTTSYQDDELEASTTYYYKIRAISVSGESDFTDDAGKLRYSYYEGTWDNLPNFNDINAVTTGFADNFDLSPRKQDDKFAFKFDGKIEISAPGEYTFFTKSDDGSQLYIGNELVVQNDFLQGCNGSEKSKSYTFNSPGIYDISVRFFEKTGGECLEVYYQGPGITKQLIPDAVLHTGTVSATTSGDAEAPTAPGDLAVKSVSNTSVGLSWIPSTDNVGVVGYNVYRQIGSGPTTSLIEIGVTNEWGDVIEEGENPDDDNDNNTTNSFYNSSFEDNMTLLSENEGMSVLSETEITAVSRISTSIGGLTEGTDYTIVVKARDASENYSLASDPVTFTTGEEAPLPIELIDFFAITKEEHIELNWITASETNNDYFVILRSLDGKNFKEIGTVDGAGNSSNMIYYLFKDKLPINGIMYYQLKQVDTNGVFATSRIIKAEYNNDDVSFALRVYPNPVKNYDFKIHLVSSNVESDVHLKITDMVGKVYVNKVYTASELLNELLMSKSGLSGGIYIISLQQAGRKIQQKIIVE